LIDSFEVPTEMVASIINAGAEQTLHPVPRRHDLPERPLGGNTAFTIEGDAFWHFDAEIFRPGATRFENLK
jgi:hypothetical protein